MTDQTLGDTTPAPVIGMPPLATAAVETVLDLDEVLSQARLVERVARICLRGDLQAEFDDLVEELGDLVDDRGNVLSEGDEALGEQSRAHEINARIEMLRAEMTSASRTVRFRALPDDEYRAFDKAHRGPDDKVKDLDRFNAELISKTAIEPTLTVEAVAQMRSKLGAPQIAILANTAFYVCNSGGVDVPKSPPFSPHQAQGPSDRS